MRRWEMRVRSILILAIFTLIFLFASILYFFSTLLGFRKQPAATTGPNFDNLVTTTAIYFDTGQRIEYSFPKSFEFDSTQEKEEKTKNIKVSSLSNDDFERRAWKNEKFIDAGNWTYRGLWLQGLGGELGWLRVGLDINRRRFSDLSESTVGREIKSDFLDHIEKLNNEVRSENPSLSDEDFGSFIIPKSNDFSWTTLSGTRMLKWSSQENNVSPRTYYALLLDPNHFLTITVEYHTSVNDDKLYKNLVQRIQGDIGKIMNLFVISASDT